MDNPRSKITLKAQTEQMLHNAVLVTEAALDLKERASSGEKNVCYLRSLAVRASRVMTAMQSSSRTFLVLARRLTASAIVAIDGPNLDPAMSSLKEDFRRLLTVLERELEVDDEETVDTYLLSEVPQAQDISKRISNLEGKRKTPPTPGVLTGKTSRTTEVDERYPQSWSGESLIDLDSTTHLPPVPEDMFACFTRPRVCASLSSLKGLRKMKMFLHGGTSGCEDEQEVERKAQSLFSENDSKSDETKKSSTDPGSTSRRNSALGNIIEETHQEK